ncbi:extracellular solute-binding protein [Bacillus mangrovi]|uniref:Extracellular solute-binding protein n=1 Tax=Metabacillus mangrovi TaxID=1491830 RepID=A0A7X2S3H0_9BACI|nr:ABC transporter substrate-binding protein [Metabacillus mangrovi]MTH52835.1 extracellular solute-binding protein [Metabacillus mangrovi]
MKKHVLIKLIILMLAVSSLSACSSSGQEASGNTTKDGKVIVDFWTFWGSETRRPVIEKIIKDFNSSQDRIVVKHTFLPFGDIWTKNLASIAAGNPADVVINDINSVAHRAKQQQATDLTQYIDTHFKDQFYPHLWDTVQYDGKPYAVPFNTDTRLLFYNKKAFREAGLNPERPPQTWEELEEYSKKLDIKEGKSYKQVGFYPLWGSMGEASWMAFGDDGKGYFQEDGNVTIHTPEKVKTMEWILSWQERLGRENVQALKAEFGSESTNPFISGKVAMWADVATFYTQIRDYGGDMEIGAAPIPAKTADSPHYSEGGGFVAEVPKGSSHPKEAMEFIKYLTGKEAQMHWAVSNFDNAANIEAAEQAAQSLEGRDKEVYTLANENLENTIMFPVPIHYPDYSSALKAQIDLIIMGSQTPEEGLKEGEKRVKAMKN